MSASAIIVFREVLEAALIISIIAAASKGILGYRRYVSFGVGAGLIGAIVVASFASGISGAFAGIGQELLNAAILFSAVLMLAWHNVWMAKHARQLTERLSALGNKVSSGELPLYVITIAVAMAVLREGSEVALFLYGIAAAGSAALDMLWGGLLGLIAGIGVSILMYRGLIAIPTKWLFNVTSWVILLLAAGLAASATGYLIQAGIVPSQAPLWNTSDWLSEQSWLGQILHILIGYQARPTAAEITAYLIVLFTISSLMLLVKNNKAPKSQELTAL